MKKQKIMNKYEKFFNNISGWESTILAVIVLTWITPNLLTYFILKFGIILPMARGFKRIGKWFGRKNK